MSENIYGSGRARGPKGTLTFSGQASGTVWEISDFNPKLQADHDKWKNSGGNWGGASFSGEMQQVSVTLIARAGSGADNTLANALKALELPRLGTVVTVTSTGAIPADQTGTWNLVEAGVAMTLGNNSRVDVTLERYWNDTAYVPMSAVS